MFVYILILFVAIAALIYWKVVRPHSYWPARGVKHGKPKFLIGHNTQLAGKESFVGMVKSVYNMHPEDRYSGIYMLTQPVLLLRDPDLIKQVTVKDFEHFTDHMAFATDDLLWSKNLFTLKGEQWRDMRATLSPAFTSSKMKSMFELMRGCGEQFSNYFVDTCAGKQIDVELKDCYTRYANDVIASCAFGVECDSMRNRDNEFYQMGKETTNMATLRKRVLMFLLFVAPKLAKVFGLKFFDQHVEDFFLNLVGSTVKYREEHNVVRPDMIHLLMEARKGQLIHDAQEDAKDTGFATVEEATIGGKNAPRKKDEITLEVMTAQALLFFFAGFDSVATLMCFCSYELAVNPEIQQRLREEIHDTLAACNGKLTYEELNKMKYMDCVIAESLRKWPSGAAADRQCVKDYTIPAERPDEVPVHLKKGDGIWLPFYGIHHDPRNYPNPDRFDPERFNDENKSTIKPYTYFPFGSGPRNCIASRFALIETKTIIFHMLNKFELTVIEKTPVPMVLSKGGFTLNAEGGFWVGIKPLTASE